MSKNPVVHFEMPYEDKERTRNFYEKAFGWTMVQFGQEMGGYIIAQTADTDKNGMVEKPGNINGGFFPKKPDWPAQYPSVVIAVESIDEAMKAVNDAGGKVLGEPMDIENVGRYVSFNDTEGNRVGILQPLAR